MLRSVLILPGGRELSSGSPLDSAIKNITLTQCVNSAQELTLGSVCAAMLEAEIIAPNGEICILPGEEVTLYREDEAGVRHLQGIFIAQKPSYMGANLMKLTAYDRVSLLDRDLTAWLKEKTDWPCPLYRLAAETAQACGVELASDQIPNGSYMVRQFAFEGITGRQIFQWVAEAGGSFCRANSQGQLEFGWYTPKSLTLSPGGERYYFERGLELADYQVQPADQVQIRLTKDDVGVCYPAQAGQNPYVISGNYLLTNDDAQMLEAVAQILYDRLSAITYTPGKVLIPAGVDINPADALTVLDRNGNSHTFYVMTRKQTGQKETLECVGSFKREPASAANRVSYQALSGKVLEIRQDIEGLQVENRDAAGRLASLQLDVSGVSAEVSHQSTDLEGVKKQVTTLEQSEKEVALQIREILENGVSQVTTATGYTFSHDGLKIQKSGEEMENRLDHTGMYVQRSGEVILQANSDGVAASDVQVRNYLDVGASARFEDYLDEAGTLRTACYYRGG